MTENIDDPKMSCQSCGGKLEEHPNQFCENYTTEMPYERRPKYNDDHAVCCCDSKAVPTKGDIDYKTSHGFTQTKTMFWCKRCGLALTFAQMDNFGDTWEEIMG